MRRDHFTLTVTNTDADAAEEPTLRLQYGGPAGNLTARLEDETGDLPDGDDVDVTFRLQAPLEDDDATGVFAVTRRLTGEYLLEVDTDAEGIQSLIEAAREDDGHYRIVIERPGASTVSLRTETLLVYDEEGGLRRQNSLIPGGVEL
jgi:hypothetical protein